MTNLSALKVTIEAIQATYEKLENGKISSEELEILLEQSRELYDRAVILRYKSYEEKVFPTSEANSEEQTEISLEKEVVHEFTEMEAAVVSVDRVEMAFEAEEKEMDIPIMEEIPSFDFSLFDDSSEEAKHEVLEEEAIEHISVTATSEEEFGLHEEKIVMEQVTLTPVSEENQRFLARFSKTDVNNMNQILMSKLDTLIGSFGLNERLQYINELFNGSSEHFSEAVKIIDNQSNIEEALLKTSVYANQFNWENDSETVEEFVIKIKRRYA
jgi:hypothetical protein